MTNQVEDLEEYIFRLQPIQTQKTVFETASRVIDDFDKEADSLQDAWQNLKQIHERFGIPQNKDMESQVQKLETKLRVTSAEMMILTLDQTKKFTVDEKRSKVHKIEKRLHRMGKNTFAEQVQEHLQQRCKEMKVKEG